MKTIRQSLIPIFLSVIFFLMILSSNTHPAGEQQFSYLADSFLHGKLYFINEPGSWMDTVLWNARYYWPLGPFPAVLLTPFVFLFSKFGAVFFQGYLQIFLVAIIYLLIYRIARFYKYSADDSLYWALAFIFASTFISVAVVPWSWWFAQVVAVVLLFIVIYESLNRSRLWLIGLCYGLLVLTRITAALTIIYFLLKIFFSEPDIRMKVVRVSRLMSPVVSAVIILFLYNYLRFGNILEQGYKYQILNETLTKARDYGLFSLQHIPGNIYYFLLSGPVPIFKDNLSHVLVSPFIKANPWGMSIFIVSPYLVELFFLKYNDTTSKYILLTIVLTAIPIFCYYGIGFRQLGYRYSLDFLPFIFLLMIRNYHVKHRHLPLVFRIMIIFSAAMNIYLLSTIFYGK